MDDKHLLKTCRLMCSMLSAQFLWIIILTDSQINITATDDDLLNHYKDKQYHLHDPFFKVKFLHDLSTHKIYLGSEEMIFHTCGLMRDLLTTFQVEEFATIRTLEHPTSPPLLLRFFTRNNRFALMNKLLNEQLLLRHFVNLLRQKSVC